MKVTDSTTPALPPWAVAVVQASAETLVKARTPFLHHGRTGAGLDCLGLALWLHERIGVRYELRPQETHYSSTYYRQGGDPLYRFGIADRCVPVAKPAVGDLVMFYAQGSKTNVGHAGVVVDPVRARFVHAFYKRGVRFDHWTDRAWQAHVAGFMRPADFAQLVRERR